MPDEGEKVKDSPEKDGRKDRVDEKNRKDGGKDMDNKEDKNDKEGQEDKEGKNDKEGKDADLNKDKKEKDGGAIAEAEKASDVVRNIAIEKEKKEALQRDVEEKQREFSKTNIIKTVECSLGNLDVYLHYEYRDIPHIYRCIIEIVIIAVFIMFLPVILVLLDQKVSYEGPMPSLSQKASPNLVSYFKNSFFITVTYIIFVFSSVFVESCLYWFVALLSLLGIQIDQGLATFLQIVSNATGHLKNTLVALLVFLLASSLYEKYTFLEETIDINHFLMTLLVWSSLFSLMLFIERIIINAIVDEIGRGSISGRIFDANYKTFIFKKLAAISQTKSYGRDKMKKVIDGMNNDFESNIYIRHNDLDMSSNEAVFRLVKSIFWYLDINNLEFESIKDFFPSNYDEVYNYLSNGGAHGEHALIPLETVRDQAISLRVEKDEIIQSLVDRDNILDRLNYVLLAGVGFLGLVLLLFLLNVNYKIYFASIGPLIFTFGWIFQGSVVELYRCFVFLLFSHPFDSGDRVVIDNQELVVKAIDLLYTTFEDTNGMRIYIPNVVMFTKNIGNIRRSDLESEEITLEVEGSTNFKQVLELKKRLQDTLSSSEKDFTGVINIRKYELVGGKIRLVLSVQHTSNFQNLLPRYSRRESFIGKLENELSNCNISYTHGYIFKP